MDPWTKKGSYRKNRAIPFVQTIFLDSFSCESSKSRTRPAISSSWNKFCTEIPLLPPNLKSQTKKPRDGPFQGSSLFSNTLTFLPFPLFFSPPLNATRFPVSIDRPPPGTSPGRRRVNFSPDADDAWRFPVFRLIHGEFPTERKRGGRLGNSSPASSSLQFPATHRRKGGR